MRCIVFVATLDITTSHVWMNIRKSQGEKNEERGLWNLFVIHLLALVINNLRYTKKGKEKATCFVINLLFYFYVNIGKVSSRHERKNRVIIATITILTTCIITGHFYNEVNDAIRTRVFFYQLCHHERSFLYKMWNEEFMFRYTKCDTRGFIFHFTKCETMRWFYYVIRHIIFPWTFMSK